jgi:hypothetical protein
MPMRTARVAASSLRLLLRSALLALAGLFLALAAASPAFAVEDGSDPGQHIGLGSVLLIFLGVPFGLLVILAVLTYAPATKSVPRYRPGRPWEYDDRWFGEQPQVTGAAAHELEPPKQSTTGGAGATW